MVNKQKVGQEQLTPLTLGLIGLLRFMYVRQAFCHAMAMPPKTKLIILGYVQCKRAHYAGPELCYDEGRNLTL